MDNYKVGFEGPLKEKKRLNVLIAENLGEGENQIKNSNHWLEKLAGQKIS